LSAVSVTPRLSARRPSALTLGIFVEAPLIVVAFVFWWSVWGDARALGDFVIFRDAGLAVLNGHSPYVVPDAAVLAENDKFVYPAAVAWVFAPFALLPLGVAKGLFVALSLLCLPAALRLFGVRDYRCYGVVFLASPTIWAVEVGALGPFLLLAAALAWRFRTHVPAVASAVAVGALAKLLLWPLFVWLLATRRFRAAAASLTVAVAVGVAGWATIGFEGMREYPSLVTELSEVMVWKAYSAAALATSFGAGVGLVNALTGALIVAGIALILALARGDDGDRRAFAGAIAVALLASPILWSHYLVLLFAPIALARPRLSLLWFAPIAFWISPHFESLGSVWKISIVLACTLGVLTVSLRPVALRAPATR
jgi:alpha-1,2-mannosyltransferase